MSSVILKKYKYGLAYDIGSSINSLVIQALKRLQIKFCNKTVVIPVPISINRLRERGFNQTVDISKTIAEHLGCEQRTDIIYRYNGDSTHQSMLDRDERLGQKNYFYIINPSLLDTYENIIIVDDVITTGTTLEQISKVIKIYNPNIPVNAICLFRGRAYYK